jgi:hypothetical protein
MSVPNVVTELLTRPFHILEVSGWNLLLSSCDWGWLSQLIPLRCDNTRRWTNIALSSFWIFMQRSYTSSNLGMNEQFEIQTGLRLRMPSYAMWRRMDLVRMTFRRNVWPPSPGCIFSILHMEATRSSGPSVVTKFTRHHIPEHGILHSHRRENHKSSNAKASRWTRSSRVQHICLVSLSWTFQSLPGFLLPLNAVAWVRERTVPAERPPLAGTVCANYCGATWSAWRIPTTVF